MAKDGTAAIAEIPTGAASVAENVALATNNPEMEPSAEFLREVAAQVQGQLKQFDVAQLTSASALVDQDLNVTDAFLYPMTIDGETAERLVTEVVTPDGVQHHVAQNLVGSRTTILNIFDNFRRLQRSLTLTNCRFNAVGKPRFGNQFLALMPTDRTEKLIDGKPLGGAAKRQISA